MNHGEHTAATLYLFLEDLSSLFQKVCDLVVLVKWILEIFLESQAEFYFSYFNENSPSSCFRNPVIVYSFPISKLPQSCSHSLPLQETPSIGNFSPDSSSAREPPQSLQQGLSSEQNIFVHLNPYTDATPLTDISLSR